MSDYKVGYGKPPMHSRFKKGQSGNPSGRPKRKTHASFEVGYEQMKARAIEEAYRLVQVLEGNKETKIPVIQAILRSVAVSAAKGNSRAQRLFIDLLKSVEEEHSELRLERDQALLEMKAQGEAELERRKQLKISGSDLFPHPDDIIYNPNTGRVGLIGPRTKEEVELWDFIDDTLESVASLRAMPPEDKKTPGYKKMMRVEMKILRKFLQAVPNYRRRPSRRARRG